MKEAKIMVKVARCSRKLLKLGVKCDKYNIPFHVEMSNQTYLKEHSNNV